MTTYDIQARWIHMANATVTPSQYTDGSLALIAEDVDDDGYPDRETLSVNLTGWGVSDPPEGHIYVPTWSENEDLPAALFAAGIATAVDGGTVLGPFGNSAVLMKVSAAVIMPREDAR